MYYRGLGKKCYNKEKKMADRDLLDPVEVYKSCCTCKWSCKKPQWTECAVKGRLKYWQPKPVRGEENE